MVVATCHSEFLGRIFQQAGVKHVICIKQAFEVQDDAVITFTDTFYGMIFDKSVKVCDAFLQAQFQVKLVHGEREGDIFQLLLPEDIEQSGKKHRCQNIGPFTKGNYKLSDSNDIPHLKYVSLQQTKLKGRQADTHKVIAKVMSNKEGRLLTIKGVAGVGKSSLIQNVLQFISERGLIKGGSVLFNARAIVRVENFMKEFNN